MKDPHKMTRFGPWLDIMPAIPLQRAVPVLHTAPRRWGGVLREVVTSIDAEGPSFTVPAATCTHRQAEQRWRVDLNDPQGFAYALRYLYGEYAYSGGEQSLYRELWERCAWGLTTDADRLALALALSHELSPA